MKNLSSTDSQCSVSQQHLYRFLYLGREQLSVGCRDFNCNSVGIVHPHSQ
eukprot:m.72388 g.72388  ORF g.72388 m.72388 type:complete len:50 (+) comp12322_c0_seq1:57-206(+)